MLKMLHDVGGFRKESSPCVDCFDWGEKSDPKPLSVLFDKRRTASPQFENLISYLRGQQVTNDLCVVTLDEERVVEYLVLDEDVLTPEHLLYTSLHRTTVESKAVLERRFPSEFKNRHLGGLGARVLDSCREATVW